MVLIYMNWKDRPVGLKDRKVIRDILKAAKPIWPKDDQLKQKDIANYMGITAKMLSEWAHSKSDRLTIEVIANLAETLRSCPNDSFESKLSGAVADIAFERLAEAMPSFAKQCMSHQIEKK